MSCTTYRCRMTAKRSWVEQIMGLPISVLARGDEARSVRADAAVREVFAELVEADRVFSPYKADSAVSLLARGEVGWDDVDPVVRAVAPLLVGGHLPLRGGGAPLGGARAGGRAWRVCVSAPAPH